MCLSALLSRPSLPMFVLSSLILSRQLESLQARQLVDQLVWQASERASWLDATRSKWASSQSNGIENSLQKQDRRQFPDENIFHHPRIQHELMITEPSELH